MEPHTPRAPVFHPGTTKAWVDLDYNTSACTVRSWKVRGPVATRRETRTPFQ